MLFAEWYGPFRPRLVAALMVLSADWDAAQDAADEAMVRSLEHWERVQMMNSPEGWAYRVAVNVLRRRMRRRALERRLLAKPEFVEMAELNTELWRIVKALPRRQREAVALRYILGLSEAEVAHRMGVAVGTASATLAAARSRLAPLLRNEEGAEVDHR